MNPIDGKLFLKFKTTGICLAKKSLLCKLPMLLANLYEDDPVWCEADSLSDEGPIEQVGCGAVKDLHSCSGIRSLSPPIIHSS